jgi:2-phosphosulfolactate phosphatase
MHWSQVGYGIRCEWGPTGAARLSDPRGVTVVVDVLSFSTSVTVAVDRGTAVLPAPWRDGRADELARAEDAVLAVGRREVTPEHPWSLSPAALRAAPAPGCLVLPSPNGSTIAAATTGVVLVACLRNAVAVAAWLVEQGYGGPDRPISLVPAGEHWPDGSLRPALEDALGAGAVAHALTGLGCRSLSPETEGVASLFAATQDVPRAVRASGSGRELAAKGFGADVEVALEWGTSTSVPLLQGRRFTRVPA